MNNTHDLLAPQLGEGGKEIKIHKVLKKIGDQVLQDENVIEAETDKATVEISSPVDGIIEEILCEANQNVPVGNVLLKIKNSQNSPQPIQTFGQQRRKNKNDSQISKTQHKILSLPDAQKTLIKQMRLSQDRIVQAQIETRIDWKHIDSIKKNYAKANLTKRPSALDIIVWATSDAMHHFEKFRARLQENLSLEVSNEALIGIAKMAHDDQIATLTVPIPKDTKFKDVQSHIVKSTENPDKTYHSLSLSDMSALKVHHGNPVVVYPAIATLFIGTPSFALNEKGEKARMSHLVLAFDHQAMNGAYAAKFLNRIIKNIKALDLE